VEGGIFFDSCDSDPSGAGPDRNRLEDAHPGYDVGDGMAWAWIVAPVTMKAMLE